MLVTESCNIFNPYWQILENFSKNQVVTKVLESFSGFFQIFWFRAEENFLKIFQAQSHYYLLKKKILESENSSNSSPISIKQ